jgi:transposase-like protein
MTIYEYDEHIKTIRNARRRAKRASERGDQITLSTLQFFAMFPEQESARVYLEGRIWPSGPVCPSCGDGSHISVLGTCATRKAGFYRCLACGFDFTVRTNTVMQRSKVPLHKWLYSMYLRGTARKGISSSQLAKEIGVTQKTAWFIFGRLREACGGDGPGGGPDSFVDATKGKRITYRRLTA